MVGAWDTEGPRWCTTRGRWHWTDDDKLEVGGLCGEVELPTGLEVEVCGRRGEVEVDEQRLGREGDG
jgi:hypothetical protein